MSKIARNEPRIINSEADPRQNAQNFEANPTKIVPHARNTINITNKYENV